LRRAPPRAASTAALRHRRRRAAPRRAATVATRRARTVLLEQTQDLVARNGAHLRDAVAIAQDHADLRGRQALLGELADCARGGTREESREGSGLASRGKGRARTREPSLARGAQIAPACAGDAPCSLTSLAEILSQLGGVRLYGSALSLMPLPGACMRPMVAGG
jgi:hypothetical protein